MNTTVTANHRKRRRRRDGKHVPPSVTIYRWSVEPIGQLPGATLNSPAAVALYVRDFLGEPDGREHVVVLYLDVQRHVIHCEEVSVGTLDGSVIHPRNVYRTAVAVPGIAGVIVAHNHPSTDPEPSLDDRRVTAQLREAGEVLGIDLLDHIIIADHTDAFVSFVEGGLL